MAERYVQEADLYVSKQELEAIEVRMKRTARTIAEVRVKLNELKSEEPATSESLDTLERTLTKLVETDLPQALQLKKEESDITDNDSYLVKKGIVEDRTRKLMESLTGVGNYLEQLKKKSDELTELLEGFRVMHIPLGDFLGEALNQPKS